MPILRIHQSLPTRLTPGMKRRRLEKSFRPYKVKARNAYRRAQIKLIKFMGATQ